MERTFKCDEIKRIQGVSQLDFYTLVNLPLLFRSPPRVIILVVSKIKLAEPFSATCGKHVQKLK